MSAPDGSIKDVHVGFVSVDIPDQVLEAIRDDDVVDLDGMDDPSVLTGAAQAVRRDGALIPRVVYESWALDPLFGSRKGAWHLTVEQADDHRLPVDCRALTGIYCHVQAVRARHDETGSWWTLTAAEQTRRHVHPLPTRTSWTEHCDATEPCEGPVAETASHRRILVADLEQGWWRPLDGPWVLPRHQLPSNDLSDAARIIETVWRHAHPDPMVAFGGTLVAAGWLAWPDRVSDVETITPTPRKEVVDEHGRRKSVPEPPLHQACGSDTGQMLHLGVAEVDVGKDPELRFRYATPTTTLCGRTSIDVPAAPSSGCSRCIAKLLKTHELGAPVRVPGTGTFDRDGLLMFGEDGIGPLLMSAVPIPA